MDVAYEFLNHHHSIWINGEQFCIWHSYFTGVSPTEALSGPIPWHGLRIFFMRDTGSHQRVFAI